MKKTMLKIAVAAAFAAPFAAQAAIHVFNVTLDQQAEIDASSDPPVPGKRGPVPGPSSATGVGIAQYDDVTNTFSFIGLVGTGLRGDLVPQRPSGDGNQHIHLGAAGVSGGVIFQLPGPILFDSGTDNGGSGTFAYFATNLTGFPEENEADLLAGNTYVNIHTSFDPAGEIRGQMVRVVPIPEPETYALMAAGLGFVGWVASRRRKVGV